MVAFSALHLHPFLVAAFYRDRDWRFAFGNYGYLLAATGATASTPAQLRRLVALGRGSGVVPCRVLSQTAGEPCSGRGTKRRIVPTGASATMYRKLSGEIYNEFCVIHTCGDRE